MSSLFMGVLVLALSIPVWPGPAWAQQPQAADTTTQADATLAALRDRVESRYQVLPIQNGIVLIPRVAAADVQSIELAGDAIAVNGQAVTGAELRDRVGDDADTIVRLSFLDPDTRRVLFGLGEPPAPPAGADSAAMAEAGEEAEEEEPLVGATQDQVRIGGSIHIRPGEVVDGDVVAVGGSVRIDGHVTGEVVAVGGSVDLGPSADVEGDVTAVGGRIHRASGAHVGGTFNEVAFGRGPIEFRHGAWNAPAPFGGVSNVIGTVMWIVVLGLLTCLALLLGRTPVERMENRVRTSPWKAAAVGLAGQILFFPVLVLVIIVLAISIIGIPLLIAIPFAILALLVGSLLGFTAVCKTVGHQAESRFGWSHASPYLSLLVGLGIIMAASFFASAIGMAGGPLRVFAVILGILGFVAQYVAWTMGFGALLLTRFGTRYRWGDEELAPVPPSAPVVA
jgi:hypothetical protein